MDHQLRTSLTATAVHAEDRYPSAEAPAWELAVPVTWGQQMKHVQMVCKRLIDLLGAGALLLIAAGPMMLIALAIKLESRGSVFHVQERVGYGGRPFRMYKFRSMVTGAHAAKDGLLDQNEVDAPLFKMKHDPRRTRVGQLIRRFSLDEMPQLFNVLRGHMSLVGPRPALVEEAGDPLGPDHVRRVLAIPGMTGLWQVSGRSLLTFREMVALDIEYAQSWSLWLDLRILWRTLPVVFRGTGAY